MKKIIFVSIFMLFMSLLFCQENTAQNNNSHIIILKDGSEYRGNLIRIDKDYVIFNINGKNKMFDKKQINSIQLHQKRMYEDVTKLDQITDTDILSLTENSDRFKTNQNQQIIMLLDKVNINFIDKNTMKINIKKAFKVLNVQGKNYSTQYFYYFKNVSKAKLLYGITISPEGKIDCIDDSAISDEPVNNQFPQYNLLHRLKFGLKNVDIGSIFVWEAEVTRQNDTISKPFYLEKQLVLDENIVKQSITVESNNDFNYSFNEGKIDFYSGKFKKVFKDNKYTFTYENEFIPGFSKDEDNIPSEDYILPFFCFGSINTWQQISTDYYEKYFSSTPDDKIKNLATTITGAETNPANQLKLLYQYISRKIELAKVSINDFYYTPLSDNVLTSSPSLNILDKSYLFTRMAESLNIPVKMYFYKKNFSNKISEKCPSISQFDSLICEFDYDNKNLYYSFESSNFDVEQYYYSVSEAQALEVTKSNSDLVMLKKISDDYNAYNYDYKCELLSDNSLNIVKTITINGSDQAEWRNDRFLSKDEFDKILQTQLSTFGNDAVISDYEFINKLDDFEKPVVFEESLQIKNYALNSGNKIKLLKIPELKYTSSSVNKTSRKLPYNIGFPYTSTYTFEITIPKNYKVGYLPENSNINNKYFSFIASYKSDKDKIIIKIINSFKTDLIPVEAYGDLKKCFETKAKITNDWIILEAK